MPAPFHRQPGRPVLGLALGSGSARGWSHIGVLRALERAGFAPDIVCGTSIGALVGAAYADGQLDRLEAWVRSLTWPSVLGLLDIKLSGGLIQGEKLLAFFRAHFQDKPIESLARPFAAVATELVSGRELWLREGSVIDAVRASMALPGLFTPAVQDGGRLLVDGGLVNPVPVSLCRAMGADVVIAVDLNWDLMGRHLEADGQATAAAEAGPLEGLLGRLPLGLGRLRSGPAAGTPMPSILDVLAVSINIMQVRITRSRLAGDPADVLVRPHLSDVALMDFHRADRSVREGELAVQAIEGELRRLVR
jgi:NTE family protein